MVVYAPVVAVVAVAVPFPGAFFRAGTPAGLAGAAHEAVSPLAALAERRGHVPPCRAFSSCLHRHRDKQ